MDFDKLADKAKEFVDERGGVDELKQEAEKLKDIAEGEGQLSEKAKAASQVAKEYLANKTPQAGSPETPPEPSETPPEP
jgi:hypothetical protein